MKRKLLCLITVCLTVFLGANCVDEILEQQTEEIFNIVTEPFLYEGTEHTDVIAVDEVGYLYVTTCVTELDNGIITMESDYIYEPSKIVIGQNKEWKQESPLGKVVNQSFVQIPFARFLQMIQYKAEEVGITVILTEESYTSGTSFLDGETATKANYNKARRVHRGLFISNQGVPINADLNGAYQILKKVVPIEWDRGWALHPVVVNIG